MGNLSTNQKKAILIIAGVLLMILSYFLLFQRNTEHVTSLETETRKYNNQVQFLSTLQLQVNEMRETTPEQKSKTDEFIQKFPSKMTQQKAIYNVYQMMVDSGIKVSSVKPGIDVNYFVSNKLIAMVETTGTNNAGNSTNVLSESAVEANPEEKVELKDMIGKVCTYEIDISGTMNQIMKALDWVSNNKEHMSVNATSLSFDSSTGKLTGTIAINFFAMNGNGVAYEEPNISGISLGSDNIFGTFNKKKKN